MSFATVAGVLNADVADNGTFNVAYPAGFGKADFTAGYAHTLATPGYTFAAPQHFGVTLNAGDVTITNRSGRPMVAGTSFNLQLDTNGGSDVPGTSRVRAMTVARLDLGTPVATSAVALRAAAAAVAGNLALIGAALTLDVPRNIIITSAGNDTGVTFTVTGRDVYGKALVEQITGANAGVAAGKKAFKSVTTIAASGNAAGNVSVGFGNVLGLPIFVPMAQFILVQLTDEANAAAGTFVAGLAPNTKSTATTADIRGTMVPASAPDGSKAYALLVLTPDPANLGGAQFPTP